MSAEYKRLLALTGEAANCKAYDFVLGAWCFVGLDTDLPDNVFESPFRHGDRRITAADQAGTLARHVIADWAQKLNTRHGVSYDEIFWGDALSSWAFHTVYFTWRIFATVSAFVEAHRHEDILVHVVERGENWDFATSTNYAHDLRYDGHVRDWVISRCLEALAPDNWRLAAEPAPARKSVKAQYGGIDFVRMNGRINGMRWWWRIVLSLLVRLKYRPAREIPTSSDGDVEGSMRSFPPAYLTLLNAVLEEMLPRSFRDLFDGLNLQAQAHKFRRGSMRVFISQLHDDYNRLVLAHARRAGVSLIAVQHGGGYGFSEPWNFIAELDYRWDGFITWGWSQHGKHKGNFIPLPSPRLCTLRDRHRAQNNEMVVAGGMTVPMCSRLEEMPETTDHQAVTIRLLQSLPASMQGCVTYRPHPAIKKTAVGDIQRYLPHVRESVGAFEDVLLQCRLIVIDHPSTTLCEALAANTPTVVCFDPDLWPITDTAWPDFEGLRQGKIFFTSPEDAARHISDIWDDVEGWWGDPKTQSARQRWGYKYARVDRFWWAKWIVALAKM